MSMADAILNSFMKEAFSAIVTVIALYIIVAPLASFLTRVISGGERTVELRLRSGKVVRLDLDPHLTTDKVSELVMAAVTSAQSGDEAAVQRTIAASHVASQEARAVAAD